MTPSVSKDGPPDYYTYFPHEPMKLDSRERGQFGRVVTVSRFQLLDWENGKPKFAAWVDELKRYVPMSELKKAEKTE